MNEKLFQACLDKWKSSNGYSPFWEELKKEFDYDGSSEQLRWKFLRERKRRGIKKGKVFQTVEVKKEIRKSPKILIFDLENTYVEVASWGINKQYINKGQILNDWFMLSYSAKWLYEEEIISGVLTPEEAIHKSDKRIVGEMWKLLDECDIAITYNGNFYDIPKINTRLIINGFPPPTPYKSIDVFQTVSRSFAFTSKSMDYVNYKLEVERKMETEGIDLWKRCVAGDLSSLSKMSVYNCQDVIALQEDYLVLRPWIKNHPNIGIWLESDVSVCGYCGDKNILWIDHTYATPSGLYRNFRCNNCNGVGRSKENSLNKNKRKMILPNV